ncbi:MAG TPA: hypothetical protein VFQ54_06865 [Thermomicrobiales bacterium]|nr:hypothetical protein [Thermomicrobiales bacterium]
MSFNAYTPPGLWDRTRLARIGFVTGLIFGIGLGWFFHGVISLIIRFGILVLLLIPLMLIAWLWWRSSRTVYRRDGGGTVMTWTTANFPGFGSAPSDNAPRSDDRRSQESGQVYDLDELKRQQERNR